MEKLKNESMENCAWHFALSGIDISQVAESLDMKESEIPEEFFQRVDTIIDNYNQYCKVQKEEEERQREKKIERDMRELLLSAECTEFDDIYASPEEEAYYQRLEDEAKAEWEHSRQFWEKVEREEREEYEEAFLSMLEEDIKANRIPSETYFIEQEMNKPKLFIQWLRYRKAFKMYSKDGEPFPAYSKRLRANYANTSSWVWRQNMSVAYWCGRPYTIIEK